MVDFWRKDAVDSSETGGCMSAKADDQTRHGHAVLDLASRKQKGEKIEHLLELGGTFPKRLLEIGTGSGGIAHYFATQTTGRFTVEAVDVTDSRQVRDGYGFRLVSSTTLPFDAASFDIVLTNHVIEHVGDRAAQLEHLVEVARVLKPDGVAYLAVPNRWMLVEPHYKVAFLSWLPHSWRSNYLRLLRKGSFYDCEPLQLHEVEALAEEARLVASNRSVAAFRAVIAIEGDKGWLARRMAALSDATLNRLAPIIPTHIYALRHPKGHGH
jgi:SAM-dependent methyltransferase